MERERHPGAPGTRARAEAPQGLHVDQRQPHSSALPERLTNQIMSKTPFLFFLQIELGRRGLALPRLHLRPFSHPIGYRPLIYISESSSADSSLLSNLYINITRSHN